MSPGSSFIDRLYERYKADRKIEADRTAHVISVEVTSHDIRNGARKDSCRCAVAIAIHRELGTTYDEENKSTRVVVRQGVTWIGTRRFNMPVEANQFICNFDNGDRVEPFRFLLIECPEDIAAPTAV